MKIALIGYGKMGKIIEQIAQERGHEIVCAFHSSNPTNAKDLVQAQIAIEFSKPDLAVDHITICAENGIPVVVGTTAWMSDMGKVETIISKNNASLLYSSNFSLGVNLFFELNKQLAKLMNKHPQYEARITETHHTEKLDAPSGTAVSLGNDLIFNHANYSTWQLEDNTPSDKNILPIVAKRIPHVPGTHEITYTSSIDQISIQHEAKNREGFALGSILAAEFLLNKKGIFTMSDVLKF